MGSVFPPATFYQGTLRLSQAKFQSASYLASPQTRLSNDRPQSKCCPSEWRCCYKSDLRSAVHLEVELLWGVETFPAGIQLTEQIMAQDLHQVLQETEWRALSNAIIFRKHNRASSQYSHDRGHEVSSCGVMPFSVIPRAIKREFSPSTRHFTRTFTKSSIRIPRRLTRREG
jgi:hypothetical protein